WETEPIVSSGTERAPNNAGYRRTGASRVGPASTRFLFDGLGCDCTNDFAEWYFDGVPMLGGEALGREWSVRCRFPDIGRGSGTAFLDLGKQPVLSRNGSPLSFGDIIGETAGLDDNGA